MARKRQFTAKPIHGGANSRAKRNSFVNGVIMKKIICIILLLSILITALASCKGVTVIEDQTETETETEAVTAETTEESTADTNVETEPVDDGIDHSFDWQYDYDFDYDSGSVEGDYIFNENLASGYSLILKRNVHTGECTTVCTDPFCEHNSNSCLFYGSTYITSVGNTMYGLMNDTHINRYVLYSFDVDKNEKKNIIESKTPISELFSYKYYIFYKMVDTGFHRMDTRTGVEEKVKPQHPAQLYFIRWGLLIWMYMNTTTGQRTYTATDLLGEDPRPFNPQIYMGSLHSSISKSGYTTISKLDKNGNVDKVMIEKGYMPMVVGENMIYFGPVADDEPHLYDPDDQTRGIMYSNGDIFIMSLETGETRLLCHVDGINIVSYGFAHNRLICGDWIGIVISPNYPLTTDKIGEYNDMVIVNMKTGEYNISRYIE